MRRTAGGFSVTLALGALGMTLAATSGCGQLWRPFLDPAVTPANDLAVADLTTVPDLSLDEPGAPLWSAETSGTTQALYAVWGGKYTSYSTVPGDGGSGGGTVITTTQTVGFAVGAAGTILQRASSGVWSASPLNLNGASPNLYAVTGRSATDVIAVGDGQLVAQWTGARWSPAQIAGAGAFFGVTPSVGQTSYLAVGAADALSVIAGSARSTPTAYTRVQADLTSTYTSDTSVWIGTSRGDLLKYEQGNFSAAGLAPGNAVRAIWARSATDVWAVGDGGYVLRYDGTKWSTSTTRFPAFTLGLHGITGNSRGEVWAVGESGTIFYFNGTAWSRWQHPSLVTLRGVFLEPVSGGLWAVGDQGLILHAVSASK